MFQYWVIVGIVLVWSHWIGTGIESTDHLGAPLTFWPLDLVSVFGCDGDRTLVSSRIWCCYGSLQSVSVSFSFSFLFFKWLRLETVVTMVAWVFLCSCSLLEVPQPNLSPFGCLSLVSVFVCFFVGLVWVRNVSTLHLKWRNCSNVFIQYLKYLAAVF